MSDLLKICCILSEHLFLRTSLEGCFSYWNLRKYKGYNFGEEKSHQKQSLHKKWSFPLRFFRLMWPNPQFPANLVTFTEKILHRKLLFLCNERFTLNLYRYSQTFLRLKLVFQYRVLLPILYAFLSIYT